MEDSIALTEHIIQKAKWHYKITERFAIVDSDWLNGIIDENFWMLHCHTVRGFQILIPVEKNLIDLLLLKSSFRKDPYNGVRPFLSVCVFPNDWGNFPITSEKEFYDFKEIEYEAFDREEVIYLDCWQDFEVS